MSASDIRGSVGRPVVDDDRSHTDGQPIENPGERSGFVEHRQHDVHQRNVAAAGVAAWALVVAAAMVWGQWLIGHGRDLSLDAAPLYGRWATRISCRLSPAVVLGALVVAVGPVVAARLRWRALLLAAFVYSSAWAVALAFLDGPRSLTDPLQTKFEYLPFTRRLDDVGAFVDTFTQRLRGYPVHVKGHPPGMVVLLHALDRVGLAGVAWVAMLVIGGGAAAAVATLVITRSLADERTARAAAPFLVVLPAGIWVASTADALYAGVGLAGVACIALGGARQDRGRDALALVGGMLLGAGAHLSYGLVLLGPLVAAVAVRRRRVRPLVVGAVGAVLVTAAFLTFGFAWWDGLAATHRSYVGGVASRRPYGYSLLGNVGALALATGPAVAAGAACLRGRAWLVVGAAVLAVAIADATGASKGEVERIWLFLVPPLAVATASLAPRVRPWLAVNVVSAIGLATMLRTIW